MTVLARQSFMTAFGKLHITRGTGVILDDDDKPIGTIKLYSWDVLPPCQQEECGCSDICSYFNGAREHVDRCLVIGSYLRNLTDVILGNLGESMTEIQLFRVGTNLIPLYKNFARMKLEEAGLHSPLVNSQRGGRIPNPIYKDIREHVKMIDMLWKSIGLQVIDEKFNLPKTDIDPTEGDYSYYDNLEKQINGELVSKEAMQAENKANYHNRTNKNAKLKIRSSIYNFHHIPQDAKHELKSRKQKARHKREREENEK